MQASWLNGEPPHAVLKSQLRLRQALLAQSGPLPDLSATAPALRGRRRPRTPAAPGSASQTLRRTAARGTMGATEGFADGDAGLRRTDSAPQLLPLSHLRTRPTTAPLRSLDCDVPMCSWPGFDQQRLHEAAIAHALAKAAEAARLKALDDAEAALKARMDALNSPAPGAGKKKKKRRGLKASLRLARNVMVTRVRAPEAHAKQEYKKMELMIEAIIVTKVLWNWPTVAAAFRSDFRDAAVAPPPSWPVTKDEPKLPAGKFRSGPKGVLTAPDLALVFKLLRISDNEADWLLGERIGLKEDPRSAAEALEELEAESGEAGWDPKKVYAGKFLGSRVSVAYEEVRAKMQPSEEEMTRLVAELEKKAEREKLKLARAAAARARADAKLGKARSYAVQQMELLLSTDPPRLKKGQPLVDPGKRRRAMAYILAAPSGNTGRAALGAVSTTHLPLKDVKACLRYCALRGCGFGGLSPVEAVESFWLYSAARIQTTWRGYSDGKQTRMAMKMIVNAQHRLLHTVIKAWGTVAHRAVLMAYVCRRPFREWRATVARRVECHRFFRLCFWPFFVWRREVRADVEARKKSHTLQRLWRCLRLLSHYRGWLRAVRAAQAARRAKWLLVDALQKAALGRHLGYWAAVARQNRELKRRWQRRGHRMRADLELEAMFRCVQLWRYYREMAFLCRGRAAQYFRTIKAQTDARHTLGAEALAAEAERRGKRPGTKAAKRALKKIQLLREQVGELPPALANLPQMPALAQLAWGADLPPDVCAQCAPLTAWFQESELPGAIREASMRYYRDGPRALAALKAHAEARKKVKRAVKHRAGVLLKTTFAGFVEYQRLARKLALNGGVEDDDGAVRGVEEARELRGKAKYDAWYKLGMSGTKMIEIDRSERTHQIEKLSGSAAHLRLFMAAARVKRDENARGLKLWQTGMATHAVEVGKMVDTEAEAAAKAKGEAKAYVDEWTLHTANKLFEIYIEYRQKANRFYELQLLWETFRGLRVAYMNKRAVVLGKRATLRRWCAICARLRYLYRGAHVYRKLRIEWVVFNRWIKHLEKLYEYPPYDVVQKLRSRRARLKGFGKLLAERAVRDRQYPYQVLNQYVADVPACFQRWVLYAHTAVALREVERHVAAAYRLKSMQSAFDGFRAVTTAKAKPPPEAGANGAPAPRVLCEAERRHKQVIGRWMGKVWSAVRVDLASRVGLHNRVRQAKVAHAARTGPSFKKHIKKLRADALARKSVEQSLLLDAFSRRGTFGTDGTRFSDAVGLVPDGTGAGASARRFQEKPVPAGWRITEVVVVVRTGQGVLGIASHGCGDDHESVSNPIRGVSNGEKQTLSLLWDERIVAVEAVYGGTGATKLIERVRFQVGLLGNLERRSWSKWFGQTVSNRPKTLSVKAAPGEVMVGFHGRATLTRLVALGLVLRKPAHEGVFSHYWTRALPADERARRAVEVAQVGEFTQILKMRHVDIANATTRAERFARKMWSSPSVGRTALRPLSCFRVVTKLSWWLFETLTGDLVPVPEDQDMVQTLLVESQETKARGAAIVKAAGKAALKADRDEAKPRPWPTRGMLRPVERQQEKDFVAALAKARADAAAMRAHGHATCEEGERIRMEAMAMLPEIPLTHVSRSYYHDRLELARTQIQLQTDFGVDELEEMLRSMHKPEPVLTDAQYAKLREQLAERNGDYVDSDAEPDSDDASAQGVLASLGLAKGDAAAAEAGGDRHVVVSVPQPEGAPALSALAEAERKLEAMARRANIAVEALEKIQVDMRAKVYAHGVGIDSWHSGLVHKGTTLASVFGKYAGGHQTLSLGDLQRAFYDDMNLQALTADEITAVHKAMDANSDGQIQCSEFLAFLRVTPHLLKRIAAKVKAACYGAAPDAKDGATPGLEAWAALFKRADKDGSGFIGEDEFRQLCRGPLQLSPALLPDCDVVSVITALDRATDAHRDGKVSVAELIDFVTDGKHVYDGPAALARRRSPAYAGTEPHYMYAKRAAVVPDRMLELQASLRHQVYLRGVGMQDRFGGGKIGTLREVLMNIPAVARNGSMTKADFQHVVLLLDISMDANDLALVFSAIDVDGSGAATVEELVAFLQLTPPVLQNARSRLRASAYDSGVVGWETVFSKIDADRSHSIDVKEWILGMRHLGIGRQEMPDADAAELFQLVDSDGTGEVSLEELIVFIAGSASAVLNPHVISAPKTVGALKRVYDGALRKLALLKRELAGPGFAKLSAEEQARQHAVLASLAKEAEAARLSMIKALQKSIAALRKDSKDWLASLYKLSDHNAKKIKKLEAIVAGLKEGS